jgi:putative endonuclease
MERGGCVYILTNKNKTVLYVGVTSNLKVRLFEHKHKLYKSSFSAQYNCNELIYLESFFSIEEAILREKQLKKWRREWKDKLIRAFNPELKDLSQEIEN